MDNGDFRSSECIELLNECDVVITNPPFSLFREFMVSDDYPLTAVGYCVDEDGKKYIRVKGVLWFTNIECGRRPKPMELTKDYSIEYNKNYNNNNSERDYGIFSDLYYQHGNSCFMHVGNVQCVQ